MIVAAVGCMIAVVLVKLVRQLFILGHHDNSIVAVK
jgi:hypothetical protein